MNPYETPKAELFWMTPGERLESEISLSARRWAMVAALVGSLAVAIVQRPDRLFLMVHGALLVLSLVAGATRSSLKSSSWMLAPGPQWATRILIKSAGLLAVGILGLGGSAKTLSWLGHPAPYGPLEGLEPLTLVLLTATGYALVLATFGTWAIAWRWRLAAGGPRLEVGPK